MVSTRGIHCTDYGTCMPEGQEAVGSWTDGQGVHVAAERGYLRRLASIVFPPPHPSVPSFLAFVKSLLHPLCGVISFSHQVISRTVDRLEGG